LQERRARSDALHPVTELDDLMAPLVEVTQILA
jgi:hypothetical protein